MPRLSKIGAAALAAFGWTGLSSVTASYLVVAGGGAGGGVANEGGSGGGGAGGYLTGTASLNPLLSYTVTVGAGGAVTTNRTVRASNGSNSVFNAITSIGGGSGGNRYDIGGVNNGAVGGSGGAGAPGQSSSAGNGSGAAGTSGQGNAGGNPFYNDGADRKGGGGGGGAGAVGANGNSGTYAPGNGGAGLASSISGSSVTYAGGGGGGGDDNGLFGTGGAGGGANGGSNNSAATAATANLGGGGGGSGNNTTGTPSNGGSGVVIISYPSPQKFGGGVVTVSGANTIHTFTTSGTLSPLSTLTASYLIVAGGGGGGYTQGGGGGAGGLLSGSGLTIDSNSTYLVTVGAGGAGGSSPTNNNSASNSSFSMVSTAAVGGGFGASNNYPTAVTGGSGGSGGGGANGVTGGGATPSGTGGTGTSGQGNNGGFGFVGASNSFGAGGGGGGAGAVGADASGSSAGNGGVGVSSSISGTSTFYAGGGGGGGDNRGPTGGTGGAGGGGAGSITAGTAGTANTGGGGGGSGFNSGSFVAGAAGGSGVVVISYAGSTQLMAGGTVTISGGNVIHTFTSSGYLTPLTLVGNSLRFRASASAYLSRTPSTAGNQKTWTHSVWVKKAKLGASQRLLALNGGNDATYMEYGFSAQDDLAFGSYNTNFRITSQLFRDPAAWYHIVLAFDTTQATAANRVKLYVNGVEVTAFVTNNAPVLNQDYAMNLNALTYIGTSNGSGSLLDGYITEVNFIDGQALTPNSFGTFNQYGVWQPITYGGSYGNNGFYLPFTATQSFTGIFSGSSQWVSLPNLAAYSVGTSNYTVEGWFYITSLGATQGLFGCNNGAGSTPKFLGLVNTSGAVLLEFTNSGGATFLTSSSGVVTTNKWHHIAWVRNSGTSTIYVNGTAVGSTTTSVNLAGLTQVWNIGYIGESGPSSLTGNASNFRLVTGTAVYTSNFIPQTTPLTAISGTQILTLQNATLVDNSTNAQVVTNNGGVTTGATYPFAILNNTIKDFGPAGNNWTANNIGQATGSTLDTMTDVPTLTSTTAANYAVWNPLVLFPNTTYQATMSNANMLMTRSGGGQGGAVTTMATTTGKFYAEMPVTAVGGSITKLGVMATNDPPSISAGSEYALGDTSASVAYRSNGARLTGGTTTNSWGATYTTGDVIGVAFDADTGKVWFAKNGTWQASGDPAAGTNQAATLPTGVPFYFSAGGESGISIALNCGQQPFTYTPPTNFLALNTFNL